MSAQTERPALSDDPQGLIDYEIKMIGIDAEIAWWFEKRPAQVTTLRKCCPNEWRRLRDQWTVEREIEQALRESEWANLPSAESWYAIDGNFFQGLRNALILTLIVLLVTALVIYAAGLYGR